MCGSCLVDLGALANAVDCVVKRADDCTSEVGGEHGLFLIKDVAVWLVGVGW